MRDIWFMLQDADRYVYHYTRAKTLSKYILPYHRLRFSKFANVNDPRESKNWSFTLRNYPLDMDHQTSQNIEEKVNDRIKHIWHVGCFVSDVYEALGTREREDKGDDIISAMYERGHSHPRMWAQYGKQYKGACLVFDRQKLHEEITRTDGVARDKVHSHRVEYKNPKPLPRLHEPDGMHIFVDQLLSYGLDAYCIQHVERYWKELFFTKATDWSQEREYRWLVQKDDDGELFVDIKDSLVGILIGDRFPKKYNSAVLKYAFSNKVEVAVMKWQNGFPQPNPIVPSLCLT